MQAEDQMNGSQTDTKNAESHPVSAAISLAKKRTKIVIRNLPSNLTSELFMATIPEDTMNHVDFWYFHPGKTSEKYPSDSLVYLHFISEEKAKEFGNLYNGHAFITSKGKEQRACVDVAPYQKVPKKKKVDTKEGTLDEDPEYLAFVESLNKPQVFLPSAEEQLDKRLAEQLANGQTTDVVVITPLMEYLRNRKANKGKNGGSKSILKRNDRDRRKRGGKDRLSKEGKANGVVQPVPVGSNGAVIAENKKPSTDPNAKSKNRRKERDEKKKKKKEAERDVQGIALAPTNNSGALDPNAPSYVAMETSVQSEEEKKRNANWQGRKMTEPGMIFIQPRQKEMSSPLNPEAPPVIPASILQQMQQQQHHQQQQLNAQQQIRRSKSTLNGNAASFSPSGMTTPMTPTGTIFTPSGDTNRRTNPANNRRSNKEGKYKVYTPKVQTPNGDGELCESERF
ncbi:hypothetical protein PROFUN_16168 [Planoprotostelium fungivorum]|uniref:UPF3 domain-containing protein n=1 Tax=Planoprotostelium fungivorum TaxID=1890364 RepID=A0A2P6MS48_9EUKA|nr:hypothetical protein PROFUN_16168 [Planoprotostelium fungivorum]